MKGSLSMKKLIILAMVLMTLVACGGSADEAPITRLTNSDAWDESSSWSPDGTKIAFDSTRDGNSQIYVMDYVSN